MGDFFPGETLPDCEAEGYCGVEMTAGCGGALLDGGGQFVVRGGGKGRLWIGEVGLTVMMAKAIPMAKAQPIWKREPKTGVGRPEALLMLRVKEAIEAIPEKLC